jgi:subtilisin family serine protease
LFTAPPEHTKAAAAAAALQAGKRFESSVLYHRAALMKRLSSLLFLAILCTPLAAAPRKFIVEFTNAPAARSARSRFRADASSVAVRREFTRAFNGAAVELPEGQSLDALLRLPYVAAVWPDTEVIAYDEPSSPSHSMRRAIHTHGGNGIVVAVIDTGIDGTHPALAGKVIGGYDFVNDDADPMDDHRHGTHVAGIIAAESAEVTGVATGVKLLAYKVLGANGSGSSSDIIAAIERALDPNNDGNPSDHADVVNLSLGGSGRPDDPLSRAVDNAVAAGVVVCVAAGNDERFHRIGSPAGAAKAITVGASYVDGGIARVAGFTSRGPATQTSAIKPDLLAPGVDILSTGLDHGTLVLSGTSMATPYVAGLAALLLEAHPDWTPERVKSALVTTAIALTEEEVMSQGSGDATLARAIASDVFASPTQLNFGLDGVTAASWTATRRITVRNESNATRTMHASVAGTSSAIAIDVVPSELNLGAGQSADVDVTIHVDNTLLGKPTTPSLAFSGVVSLTWNGDALRLPWAFLRAGRATISAPGAQPQVLWGSDVARYSSAAILGADSYEVLLEPGVFDFVIAAVQEGAARMVIAEQQNVEGDITLAVTPESTPHEIRLAGADEKGTPFPDGDGDATLRSTLVRLIVPNEYSLAMPSISGRLLYTSAFSNRYGILATESFIDRPAARIYVAQYPPLLGISASHVLQPLPGDYAAQDIDLHFPRVGTRREIELMPRDWPRRPDEFGPRPPSLRFAVNAEDWSGTLFMTPETHADFASGVQLSMYTAGDPAFPASVITPMIRRNANGFFATRGFSDSPLPVSAVASEALEFGRGAIHIPGLQQIDATGVAGDAEIYGDRGDRRRSDTLRAKVKVRDEAGNEIAAGPVPVQSFFLPLPHRGRFSAEVRVAAFAIDDRIGEATLTTRFDTTHGNASPPSITSMAILDGAGRHATKLPANGNATLVFSAADHETGEYRRIVDSATKVFFRRRNTTAWVQLTAVATGVEETAEDLGRFPSGLLYRVDLKDALRLGAGEYELAIEVADEQGTTATWQLAPAFIVENAVTRRRAVGK